MIDKVSTRDAKKNTAAMILAAGLGLALANAATAADVSAKTHIIEISKFKFTPNSLQVRPGDTIKWVNRDIVPHTATAKDKSWDSGTIVNGGSTRLAIKQDLRFSYYCRFHPKMLGQFEIVVQE